MTDMAGQLYLLAGGRASSWRANSWRAHLWRFIVTLVATLLVWLFLAPSLAAPLMALADGSSPYLVAFSPAAEATGVPIDSPVSVTWSQPMRPDSHFAVTGPEGFVAGQFAYNPATYTVTFRPASWWRPNTRYGALVAGAVGAAGEVQGAPVQWNFTTVGPTSVDLVTLSARPGVNNAWWWTAWPWLMVLVSAGSLAGFWLVNRRR